MTTSRTSTTTLPLTGNQEVLPARRGRSMIVVSNNSNKGVFVHYAGDRPTSDRFTVYVAAGATFTDHGSGYDGPVSIAVDGTISTGRACVTEVWST